MTQTTYRCARPHQWPRRPLRILQARLCSAKQSFRRAKTSYQPAEKVCPPAPLSLPLLPSPSLSHTPRLCVCARASELSNEREQNASLKAALEEAAARVAALESAQAAAKAKVEAAARDFGALHTRTHTQSASDSGLCWPSPCGDVLHRRRLERPRVCHVRAMCYPVFVSRDPRLR